MIKKFFLNSKGNALLRSSLVACLLLLMTLFLGCEMETMEEVPEKDEDRIEAIETVSRSTSSFDAAETLAEPLFYNESYYRSIYPDLSHLNSSQLLNHWKNTGIYEGRTASPALDIAYYKNKYGDLRNAFGNNTLKYVEHFANYGIWEGREASEILSVDYYRIKNNDLRFKNNLDIAIHFMQSGIREGRNGAPDNDTDTDSAYVNTQKYYKIVNRNSGKVLDVEGISADNGADIHQWNYGGGDNQKWYFMPTEETNVYIIRSKFSGKVLDVSGNSTATDANIHQWDLHHGNNQKWKIQKNSSGYFNIISIRSNKALRIKSGSTSNGATVVQYPLNTWYSEQWRIVEVESRMPRNIIHKEVLDAKKVCDLGRALFVDNEFNFGELYNLGPNEKITWGTPVKDTRNGSYAGVLYGYMYNGSHTWVYLKKNLDLDETVALLGILNNPNASEKSIDNWSRAQADDGKAVLLYQPTLLGKGAGFVIVDRHQNIVIENDWVHPASISSKKYKHTYSPDNVNLLHSTVYDTYWNGQSTKFAEVKYCFSEGTQVVTESGLVNIENIKRVTWSFRKTLKPEKKDTRKLQAHHLFTPRHG